MYRFKDENDGGMPDGGLVFDKKGMLFGTTHCGGVVTCDMGGPGVVFSLKPNSGGGWGYRLIYSFKPGSDAANPSPNLVFDSHGNLYGTAASGGKYQFGIAFTLVPPTKRGGQWKEIILYSFTGGADGLGPDSGLIFDKVGGLYGTTYEGGNPSGGVIYCLHPQGKKWNFSVIYNFEGPPDGDYPIKVSFDKAGDLSGTTLYGGSGTVCQGGCGTVFKVSP
jgi:hypothetical protein